MLTAKQGALLMVRKGFRVFRVEPNGKEPYRSGINEATDNVGVVEQWFDQNPRLNYGVATGGLVVLDVDVKKGDQWLDDYAGLGALPKTFTVTTPTGGMHLYFAGAESGQKPIAGTIDVRSRGGFVVGPGSTINGKPYRIAVDAPAAEAPPHIVERLARLKEKAADTLSPVAELDTPGAIAHATSMLQAKPGADLHGRNDALFKLACRVKDHGVSEALNRELLLEHWCPRCTPPMDDVYEIEKTVRSAYANGLKPPGVEADEFETVAECPELAAWAEMRNKAPAAPPPASFVDIDLLQEPATYAARPWLFPGDILRGSLTGIVAAGGIGKSMLTVAMAVAAASGKPDFLGMRLAEGGPFSVLLIANEDDYQELQGRIAAVCQLNGIDRTSLQGRLKTYNPADASRFLAAVRDPKTKRMVRTKVLAELEHFVSAQNVDMVVFDPFVEIHTGVENDSVDVAAVLSELRGVARRTHTAGVVIHHTKKPTAGVAEAAGDADSARGSTAFRGNVRRMFTLLRPTPDDVKRFRLTQAEKRTRLRLDDGKTSYTAQDGKPRWYELASVRLANNESYGALRRIEMRDRGEEDRRAYFDILAAWIVEQGGTVALKTAARKCKENPLLRDTGDDDASVSTLGNRIKSYFAEPITYDGLQMWFDDEAKLLCCADALT